MTWLGMLILLVETVLPVQVTPTSGDPYAAELKGITSTEVQLVVDGAEKSVPTSEISRLVRAEANDSVGPRSSAGLVDGSRLRIEGLTIDGEQAKLSLRDQADFEVPLKQLLWVRFRAPSPGVDDAWLGMLGEPQAGDRLVIRRDGNAIDPVSGVIKAADQTKVEFDLGGDVIPAPIERLEGLIFGGTEQASTRGQVLRDVYGSEWAVAKMVSAREEGSLAFEMADSQLRELPLDQIEEIRFADNTLRLAETDPISSQYTPLIQSSLDPNLLQAWLGARVVPTGDLLMRADSEVTYRLDPQFKTLTARIVPDRSVSAGTGAEVVILLDDAVVWQETVMPADSMRGVEIPIGDASRVRFKVGFGENEAKGDAGDVIRIVQPRLVQ